MNIINIILDNLIFFWFFVDIVCLFRDNKYQKIWNKEKAMRMRVDPAITRAELCEQYVMFRKKNKCNVEF